MSFTQSYLPPGLPTAPPFPESVAFPSPEGNPLAGVNPYSGSTNLPGSGFMSPSSTALSAMGLGEEGMSEEEAIEQTRVALAKLATISPQVAEQLAEQRANEGSGGFVGFLKDVAGTILSPALSMGGKILDIIGRPSHIIPQWFNPDDKGNWLEDIGQALSGEDKTNWNEVFQNRGILENAGWLRATIGFGLDVVTDPVTWATVGASAGVSTATRAAGAARPAPGEGPAKAAVSQVA